MNFTVSTNFPRTRTLKYFARHILLLTIFISSFLLFEYYMKHINIPSHFCLYWILFYRFWPGGCETWKTTNWHLLCLQVSLWSVGVKWWNLWWSKTSKRHRIFHLLFSSWKLYVTKTYILPIYSKISCSIVLKFKGLFWVEKLTHPFLIYYKQFVSLKTVIKIM